MTELAKSTITKKELKAWIELGKEIGTMGNIPMEVFNWYVDRFPSSHCTVALAHPHRNAIFLTWRNDRYFSGLYLPCMFMYYREPWTKAIQRIVAQKIGGINIKEWEKVDNFHFGSPKQDPRGDATCTLFFVRPYDDNQFNEFCVNLDGIKKGFFGPEMPPEIMQVKLSPKIANHTFIPDPPCSSHEIMFKATIGHLTGNQNYLKEVADYQANFC